MDHEILHPHIQEKLDFFYKNRQIPNILFHGSSGTGKRTLVYQFLNKIYGGDKHKIKTNTMNVNCAHGKGIKFIRDDVKFFAKTNIQCNSGVIFKSIVLINADCLTIDAQSALRRCIELFSHNTRFFIIIENKDKLLNPILSRFCEIYVPEYMKNGEIVNLHQHAISKKYGAIPSHEKMAWFLSQLEPIIHESKEMIDSTKIVNICNTAYDLGYSCLDLVGAIQESEKVSSIEKAKLSMTYQKIKSEYRCEKLLMMYLIVSLKNEI
jgi:DNA polymerase III delta prime subunit